MEASVRRSKAASRGRESKAAGEPSHLDLVGTIASSDSSEHPDTSASRLEARKANVRGWERKRSGKARSTRSSRKRDPTTSTQADTRTTSGSCSLVSESSIVQLSSGEASERRERDGKPQGPVRPGESAGGERGYRGTDCLAQSGASQVHNARITPWPVCGRKPKSKPRSPRRRTKVSLRAPASAPAARQDSKGQGTEMTGTRKTRQELPRPSFEGDTRPLPRLQPHRLLTLPVRPPCPARRLRRGTTIRARSPREHLSRRARTCVEDAQTAPDEFTDPLSLNSHLGGSTRCPRRAGCPE